MKMNKLWIRHIKLQNVQKEHTYTYKLFILSTIGKYNLRVREKMSYFPWPLTYFSAKSNLPLLKFEIYNITKILISFIFEDYSNISFSTSSFFSFLFCMT